MRSSGSIATQESPIVIQGFFDICSLMRSLRSRLTLSYTILVATVLIVAVGTLTVFAVGFLKRAAADEIASAEQSARAIVASASPALSDVDLLKEIDQRVRRPGIVILPGPRRGGFDPFAPPPPAFGPPTFRPPALTFGVPDWGMHVISLLEPRPALVPLRHDMLLIALDHAGTWRALRGYFEAVFVAVTLVVLAAWLVARWITKQAIAPLLEVTDRLRHFASGDFTPQTLTFSGRSEIGDIIQAYNGAAAQVADAFAEREAVEKHMRRFVADASHELRTPLSVIAASHEVLRSGEVDDPLMRKRIFSNLKKETNRMKTLVDRLVALARLERPERPAPEALDVVALIHEVTNAVRVVRGGNVTVEAPETAVAYVDQTDACDALGNLIENALKYGAEGPVTVGVETSGTEITVTVCDLGPGIPPGDRPHLFERFYRGWVGRTYGGSGLGLAIAKRAAERAGGMLVLRCGEPGKTCFALTLPRPAAGAIPVTHA